MSNAVHADTTEILGPASAELVAASAARPTGIVAAYCRPDGTWEPVAASALPLYRDTGIPVIRVYVEG